MSRPDGYLLPLAIAHDPHDIVDEVARAFLVSAEDLFGRDRSPQMVVARACAMAVLRQATGMSFPGIGRLFDRDHTTVMHHVRKVMDDPELRRGVRLVVEELSPPPRLFALPDEGKEAL